VAVVRIEADDGTGGVLGNPEQTIRDGFERCITT